MNLENGETMLMTWLVFSPVNCAAYCFPSMLFQKAEGKHSFGKPSGFDACCYIIFLVSDYDIMNENNNN